MSLDRTDFGAFFAAVHDGHPPFRWQERLLDHVLHTGRWPDQLVAPTGAGKTSVIDVHVFAVALMASGHPTRVPRRLALVVDRRALVDDQHEHAKSVAALLADARRGDGVLAAMAEALGSLHVRGRGPADPPLRTALLRGGAPPAREWRDDPSGCVVLCATPDMWGSRLLLSGYGSRSQARPREAGLLAFDTVAVVDEAHLSQQLMITARRVAELAAVAEEPLGVPVLQVVETTATPSADAGVAVGVEPDDLAVDQPLRQRLTAPKPVTLLPLESWPIPLTGSARTAGVKALADEALRLHEAYGPKTVGCFVNTVAVAVAVAAELRVRGANTALVCGRLRPYDLASLRLSGLLSITGDAEVDVLVATQSLEVGVDLDLAAAVTELAPGGAIAQRAGRVNRLGRHATALTVVVPAADLPADDKLGQPYGRDDLAAAHTWLAERQSDPDGLAPWALRAGRRPPLPAPRRDLFQRLELAQAWHLARTSDDLAAPQKDLELWLSDDLDGEDYEIGLVVRRALPADPSEAVKLVEALPPRDYEVFPVSIRQAGTIRARLKPEPSAVLIRPGDGPRPWSDDDRLRPGDQLVVDDSAELFTHGVFTRDGNERVVDVLDALDEPKPGEVVLRIERDTAAHRRLLDAVAAATDANDRDDLDSLVVAQLLREYRDELAPQPMVVAAAGLLDRPEDEPAGAVVRSYWRDQNDEGEPELVRLLVIDLRDAVADAELRQTWTPYRRRVTLRQHAEAVAHRADVIATRLGLDAELVEVFRLAGLHHDDGKADDRFQCLLGAGSDIEDPLAKSGVRDIRRILRLRAASGLPTGWRHEQLSVVRAWPFLSTLDADRRDLAARLIGTSHGNGRHGFPHTSEQLVADADEIAAELFDEGLWDELIERTHIRWGVWGCAYLEALLRAADGQVSAEGS